jgi:hypothetical protein
MCDLVDHLIGLEPSEALDDGRLLAPGLGRRRTGEQLDPPSGFGAPRFVSLGCRHALPRS